MKTTPPDPGLTALKQALKTGQPKRLYVFHGEETYLLHHYLGLLKKSLVEPAFEAFNFVSLEARGLTPEGLTEAVESLPAFAPRKLVVVRDFDVFKPGEEFKEPLERLLADLPETVCLVFYYLTVPCKPDARTKLYTLVKKNGALVAFNLRQNADLIPWIIRHFADSHKSIDRALCEYLLFRCGHSMTALNTEIEKVAAWAPEPHIEQRDIDAVVTPVLDAVVFDMTDALAAGDASRALSVLLTLREMKEEPIVLLAVLGKNLRGLYAAKLAHEAGQGSRALMQLLGYHSTSTYPAEKLMQASRRRSMAWCRRAVELCAESDLTLKSGGGRGDRGRVIEWIIASLSANIL
ncbi:MAG: DNA polymerase III subunit delta [Oscillospiraceae bacterium]|jgi:DNA polymerase-3 subunit delta|nr:DNA polymerase III subunit delta [Oscillospiraceae bacterium]